MKRKVGTVYVHGYFRSGIIFVNFHFNLCLFIVMKTSEKSQNQALTIFRTSSKIEKIMAYTVFQTLTSHLWHILDLRPPCGSFQDSSSPWLRPWWCTLGCHRMAHLNTPQSPLNTCTVSCSLSWSRYHQPNKEEQVVQWIRLLPIIHVHLFMSRPRHTFMR